MGKLWLNLNGKKTTIGAIIFLISAIFRIVSGEQVDPAEIGAAIIVIIGVIHKAVKNLVKNQQSENGIPPSKEKIDEGS